MQTAILRGSHKQSVGYRRSSLSVSRRMGWRNNSTPLIWRSRVNEATARQGGRATLNLRYITAASKPKRTIGELYKYLRQFHKGSRLIVAGGLAHVCDRVFARGSALGAEIHRSRLGIGIEMKQPCDEVLIRTGAPGVPCGGEFARMGSCTHSPRLKHGVHRRHGRQRGSARSAI